MEKRNELNLAKANNESKRITRDSIQTALIYLMKDIPFKDITVTSIVKRAGVSRAGFYRNYNCKEDVLKDTSNTLYQKLHQYYVEELHPLPPYERYVKLFRKFKERSDLFNIMLLSEYQHNYVFDFEFFIDSKENSKSTEDHYRYVGMVYAFRYMIRNWFQNGMKESPEEMAEIFCNIF